MVAGTKVLVKVLFSMLGMFYDTYRPLFTVFDKGTINKTEVSTTTAGPRKKTCLHLHIEALG